MHHAMLDKFAARDTAVHRLDPAAKTVAALAVILATVLVQRDHLLALAVIAGALALYHAIGRIPVQYALKRLLIVSPFALAIVVLFPLFEPGRAVWSFRIGSWALSISDAGLLRAAHLLSKFVLCVWTTLLLLATTPFHGVLGGLTRLRVPRAFVVQLAFLYRYLWVLMDEMMRMRRARAARDGGQGPWRLRFRSHAGVVGVLFLRTYGRAERIYWAMAARGFDGTLPAAELQRTRTQDVLFLIGVLIAAGAVVAGDRLAYG
ncbi:MAG TPA: cobalt ECF transporter T component CbiQ [Phycisphaerae bacterium]|nr:cobalt ECF transporter T component CbiQ [Phycisphaerae bacterium]